MDDGSGSIAVDEAENNNITLNWGITWSTGINGGGLLFDGVNVDTSAENILDNYAGDFSISIWLKFPTGAVSPKWSFGKSLIRTEILVSALVTGWILIHWSRPLFSSTMGYKGTGLLNNLSINDRTAYRNGQYISQSDISILGTNALTDDKLFKLGSAGEASSQYTGSMDNVAVYEFVLQPEDVQDLCEAAAGVGNCP